MEDIPALRSCQLTASDFLLGTGNFQRDPVSLPVEVSSTWMGEPGWVKGNGRRDKGRWVNISFLWCLAILARSQRSQMWHSCRPLPLTLCTSMRSSAAGHRHKSAPGCAGLQAGEQSCTSSPQQSAPGAHHCSSARDCTEWLGDKRMHSVPPGLSGQRQQGQQSALRSGSDRSWLCDLSYFKNL